MQHAVRMRRILSCVACAAVSCFYTLSHKRHDFRENVMEYEMCVLIFCATFVWNISHSKQNSVRYYHKMYKGLHWNAGYSYKTLMKVEFSQHIFEKYSDMEFMKILPVGTELFHADGQTDGRTDIHDEATNRYSQFCERLSKCVSWCSQENSELWNCLLLFILKIVPCTLQKPPRSDHTNNLPGWLIYRLWNVVSCGMI